jgi:DNA-binding response OmpR family regulator
MSARILIVDDDVLLCDLVRMALERAGFTVESAHSAQAALEKLKAQPADLILLDVMMSDINGFDMLRRMKGDPALAAIPVVFLSARVDAIAQQTGLEAGAVDYLPKPVSQAVLVERVRAILAGRA